MEPSIAPSRSCMCSSVGFDTNERPPTTNLLQDFEIHLLKKITTTMGGAARKAGLTRFDSKKILKTLKRAQRDSRPSQRSTASMNFGPVILELAKQLIDASLPPSVSELSTDMFKGCRSMRDIMEAAESRLVEFSGEQLIKSGFLKSNQQYVTIRKLSVLRSHVANLAASRALAMEHKEWDHDPNILPRELERELNKVLADRDTPEKARSLAAMARELSKKKTTSIPTSVAQTIQGLIVKLDTPLVFAVPLLEPNLSHILGSPSVIFTMVASQKKTLVRALDPILDLVQKEGWVPPFIVKAIQMLIHALNAIDDETAEIIQKSESAARDGTLTIADARRVFDVLASTASAAQGDSLSTAGTLVLAASKGASGLLSAAEGVMSPLVHGRKREEKSRSISLNDLSTYARRIAGNSVGYAAGLLAEQGINIDVKEVVERVSDTSLPLSTAFDAGGAALVAELFCNAASLSGRGIQASTESDFAGCSTVGKSIKRAELLLARQAIATVKGTMELDEVSKANLEACETIAEVRTFIQSEVESKILKGLDDLKIDSKTLLKDGYVDAPDSAGRLDWKKLKDLGKQDAEVAALLSKHLAAQTKLPQGALNVLQKIVDKSPALSAIAPAFGIGSFTDGLSTATTKLTTGTASFKDLEKFFQGLSSLLGAGDPEGKGDSSGAGAVLASVITTVASGLGQIERMTQLAMASQGFVMTTPSPDACELSRFIRHCLVQALEEGATQIEEKADIEIDIIPAREAIENEGEWLGAAVPRGGVLIVTEISRAILEPHLDAKSLPAGDPFEGCDTIPKVIRKAERLLALATVEKLIKADILGEAEAAQVRACSTLADLKKWVASARERRIRETLKTRNIAIKGVKNLSDLKTLAQNNAQVAAVFAEEAKRLAPLPSSFMSLVKTTLDGSPLMAVVGPAINPMEGTGAYLDLITSRASALDPVYQWASEFARSSPYIGVEARQKIVTNLAEFQQSQVLGALGKVLKASDRLSFSSLKNVLDEFVAKSMEANIQSI